MENDNKTKNLAKLVKLQRQIKTDQEKLKFYIKKFAPPKKKAKREYAHFPARDNDGRLIRHPGRTRKFAEIAQNKEEGNWTLNDESSVQQDGLMFMINANVVAELKTKIKQLRISTKSNDKTSWEKRVQRETENLANIQHRLFEAVIKN